MHNIFLHAGVPETKVCECDMSCIDPNVGDEGRWRGLGEDVGRAKQIVVVAAVLLLEGYSSLSERSEERRACQDRVSQPE